MKQFLSKLFRKKSIIDYNTNYEVFLWQVLENKFTPIRSFRTLNEALVFIDIAERNISVHEVIKAKYTIIKTMTIK